MRNGSETVLTCLMNLKELWIVIRKRLVMDGPEEWDLHHDAFLRSEKESFALEHCPESAKDATDALVLTPESNKER